MFAGLMSRWMMPAVWAASSASAIWIPSRSTVSSPSGPAASRSCSVVALQILHGDERASVLLADVVDRADVWMVERRCGPGFALKAAQGLGITRQIFGDELERNGTVKPRIFGFVHHAHPAAAELLDDAVVRERLTDQRIAAGLTAVVAALSGELACGEIDRRSAEEPVGTVVCGEQRTDFVFQPLVAATRVAKIGVALYRGNVERGLQQLIDVIPAVIVHGRSGRRALDTTRLSRFSTPASR